MGFLRRDGRRETNMSDKPKPVARKCLRCERDIPPDPKDFRLCKTCRITIAKQDTEEYKVWT